MLLVLNAHGRMGSGSPIIRTIESPVRAKKGSILEMQAGKCRSEILEGKHGRNRRREPAHREPRALEAPLRRFVRKLACPLHPDHRKSIITAGLSQKCQVGDTRRIMIRTYQADHDYRRAANMRAMQLPLRISQKGMPNRCNLFKSLSCIPTRPCP